jgi:hypothetical protein
MTGIEDWTLRRIEGLVATPRGLALFALAASLVPVLLTFPDAFGTRALHWPALERQFAHPLLPQVHPPESHDAKLALRVTVPAIAHVLGLGRAGVLALDAAAGVALIVLLAALLHAAVGDPVVAALGTLGVASTLTGAIGFVDYGPYFDAVALAFLLAAMWARALPLIAAFVLLAAFTDERAALAALFVAAWHARASAERSWARSITVAVCLLIWFGLRVLLGAWFGLRTPMGDSADVGVRLFLAQLGALPVAVFTVFEGLWPAVLAGLFQLVRASAAIGALAALTLIAVLLAAGAVHDTSRGALYSLPLLPLALGSLAPPTLSTAALRRVLLWSAVVCLLAPTVFVLPSRW